MKLRPAIPASPRNAKSQAHPEHGIRNSRGGAQQSVFKKLLENYCLYHFSDFSFWISLNSRWVCTCQPVYKWSWLGNEGIGWTQGPTPGMTHSRGYKYSSAINQHCDLGQVLQPLWVLLSSCAPKGCWDTWFALSFPALKPHVSKASSAGPGQS